MGKGKNWGLPFIGGNGAKASSSANASGENGQKSTGNGISSGAGERGGAGAGGKSGGVSTGNESTAEVKAPVGMAEPVGSSKEFTGLFIFDFDEEGRILSHTIEHVQEGGQWEKGVGAKVVGLTDWLLGGMKGSEGGDTCPAFSRKQK